MSPITSFVLLLALGFSPSDADAAATNSMQITQTVILVQGPENMSGKIGSRLYFVEAK